MKAKPETKNEENPTLMPVADVSPKITKSQTETSFKSKKKISKFSQIFTSVGDIGALITTLIYSTYIGLMLFFKVGNTVLNYCILGLTGVYIILFIFKLAYLNRVSTKSKKFGKIAKLTYKYSKYFMKLAAASVVIVSLVNVQYSNQNVMSLIGVIIVLFSFMISLLWDIVQWIAKRKFKELKDDWTNLSSVEKKKRVEGIIKTIINSIDNVNGIETYLEVASDTTKMIGSKVADIQKKNEEEKRLAQKNEKKSVFDKFFKRKGKEQKK